MVKRNLKAEINLSNIFMEQLYTFGDFKRDPRMRIVSTSYMFLVDKNRLKDKLNDNVAWFHVNYFEDDEKMTVLLDHGVEEIKIVICKRLKELTTDRYKYSVIGNNDLTFDHSLVIASGISRFKNKIEYTI